MYERGIILLVFHLIETYSTLLFRSPLCKKKKIYTFLLSCLLATTHTHRTHTQRETERCEESEKELPNFSGQEQSNAHVVFFYYYFLTIFLFHQVFTFQSTKNNPKSGKMHCNPREKYNNQNLYKSICVSFEMHYFIFIVHLSERKRRKICAKKTRCIGRKFMFSQNT